MNDAQIKATERTAELSAQLKEEIAMVQEEYTEDIADMTINLMLALFGSLTKENLSQSVLIAGALYVAVAYGYRKGAEKDVDLSRWEDALD